MQNYDIEKSLEGISLSRKNVSDLELVVVPGFCRANIISPFLPRHIKWYDELEIITEKDFL